MGKTRSELREKIMIILYQSFLNKTDVTKIIEEKDEYNDPFIKAIVFGVTEYINDIDKIANKHLNKWTIDRLGKTDQAILRMGIYELIYTDTPEIVSINEAIELAKRFSDEDVYKMINGVLDQIYKGKD